MQTIIISSRAEKRLKSGHLWLFSNEVEQQTPLKNIADGEQVAVQNASGKLIAYAMMNPKALICGRIMSRKKPFDRNVLKQRLKQALTLREQYYDKPFYRWVYAEGDYLPGLIVDRYGDVCVVQINSLGLEAWRDDIAQLLTSFGDLKGVLFRNDGNSRKQEGFTNFEPYCVGDVPELIEIEENAARFAVPVYTGQKTGWFYDHRDNRQFMAQTAKDKTVLDVFSYAGAWGLNALSHGAKHLTAIDLSGSALDTLENNAKLNGFADKVDCIEGNAADAMQALAAENAKFDIVVLDPPAFIKKKKDYHKGLAAYRKYNELALRLLAPNGLLVSASCSMHLTEICLQETVVKAARHIDRNVSLIHRGGHGVDHPMHPAMISTEYLKAQFYQLR